MCVCVSFSWKKFIKEKKERMVDSAIRMRKVFHREADAQHRCQWIQDECNRKGIDPEVARQGREDRKSGVAGSWEDSLRNEAGEGHGYSRKSL